MNPPNLTLQEYARRYFDFGWNIIPLFKYSKNPASASHLFPQGGWLEYQKRKITKEEFNKFFIENKPTGVGLITGKISGVVVVDEDSYKQGGMRFELDSPLKVKTASGGKHYYFRYEDQVKSSGFRQGVNIEVKGDGGFVVLPPSEVLNKEGKIGKYVWEKAATKIHEIPTIRESQLSKYKNAFNEYQRLHDLVNADLGTRHNNLLKIALKMFLRFKKEEWDLAADYIRDAASKFNPPYDTKDAERIIRDAANFISTHSKEEVEERIQKQIEIKVYSSKQAEELYAKKQKEYGEGLTTGFEKLDKYFKFLPEQVYMLSASTHIGKTTFVLNIASLIAKSGHKVLFASLEQGVQIVPRIKSILGEDKLPEKFSILDTDGFPTADDFITTINELPDKPEILFLDHLHYFARGNKKANEEIDRIIVEIQVMAKKLKIPIFVISHVRKLNDSKAPTMDDLKDSVSLSQIPAVVMLLHRDTIDPDLQLEGQGIYNPEGYLFINKNRIQGKTGSLKIRLENDGKIIFL